MRTFTGIILGCLLTFAVLYIHDSAVTSTVASGTDATSSRSIVNWNVAATEWGYAKDNVRMTWTRLTSNMKT